MTLPSEPPDLRPDPEGWLVRFLGVHVGWEACTKDDERGDNGRGIARGPVFFSGKTRSEVLDLIYDYDREKLEGLRRAWIDDAREVLEFVESWMSLRFEDPFDAARTPIGADETLSNVRRVLRDVPPTENKP